MNSFILTAEDLCLLLMIATGRFTESNYEPNEMALRGAGLILCDAIEGNLKLTLKGQVYLSMLLEVPEPVQKWGKP